MYLSEKTTKQTTRYVEKCVFVYDGFFAFSGQLEILVVKNDRQGSALSH